jgi:hypothetical protein
MGIVEACSVLLAEGGKPVWGSYGRGRVYEMRVVAGCCIKWEVVTIW